MVPYRPTQEALCLAISHVLVPHGVGLRASRVLRAWGHVHVAGVDPIMLSWTTHNNTLLNKPEQIVSVSGGHPEGGSKEPFYRIWHPIFDEDQFYAEFYERGEPKTIEAGHKWLNGKYLTLDLAKAACEAHAAMKIDFSDLTGDVVDVSFTLDRSPESPTYLEQKLVFSYADGSTMELRGMFFGVEQTCLPDPDWASLPDPE